MRIDSMMALGAMACSLAFAQNNSEVLAKVRAEGLAGGVSTARFGLTGPMVKGAPYSAEGVTETSQTLGDGTHINRQESYTIYRDGEGRIRRESGEEVWISDPMAKATYVLNTKQQTARKLGLSTTVVYGKIQRDKQQAAKLKAEAQATASGLMSITPDSGHSEALGKQSMEGVEVEGTRTTMVIPQGQIGNDRPLQIVRERWESSELHVTVLAKHSDPMLGDTVERLTNIHRGEPDAALFQIPAGYAVESDQ